MDADAHPPLLALTPDGSALRRALGPTPWVALEVLMARSHRSGSGIVADVSVRAVAAELGIAKDTAARALATLRAKGIVMLRQARTPLGRYAAGSYVFAAPDALGIAPRTVSPSTKSRTSATQLSLLEAD